MLTCHEVSYEVFWRTFCFVGHCFGFLVVSVLRFKVGCILSGGSRECSPTDQKCSRFHAVFFSCRESGIRLGSSCLLQSNLLLSICLFTPKAYVATATVHINIIVKNSKYIEVYESHTSVK